MNADALGHQLLAERIARVPELLRSIWEKPPGEARSFSRPIKRVVATGIGSSEAQARYFAWLLNTFTDIPARFAPLAVFVDPFGPTAADHSLAVFSQGLSANAGFALSQTRSFAQTLLFTSATEAGQRAAGKPARAEFLAHLTKGGAEVMPFPIEDEYTILIRIIGPACGFAAAHQFVEALPGSRLKPLAQQAGELLAFANNPVGSQLREDLVVRADQWKSGGVLLLPAPLPEFAQNIACKFVEGLFWSAPCIVELMQFAHGSFQLLASGPRPVCVVRGPTPFDADLTKRATDMLRSIGIKPTVIPLPVAPAIAPIALELLLNPVFGELIRHFGIDQANWPGKGLDGPIYLLDGPSNVANP